MALGMGGIELLLFLFFGLGGSIGAPLGLPPGPEDPVMSAIAPQDGLLWSTWTGRQTGGEPQTVTERWMTDPEIVAAWQRAEQAYVAYCRSMVDQEDAPFVDALAGLTRHLISHSVAFYISDMEVSAENGPFEQLVGGVVFDLGDDPAATLQIIGQIESSLLADLDEPPQTLTLAGRPFRSTLISGRPENPLTWGRIDDRHFAVTMGETAMAELLERLKTPPPAWLTEMRQRLPVDRVSAMSWVNGEKARRILAQAIPVDGRETALMAGLDRLGLNRVRQIGMVTGLDRLGFLGRGEVILSDGEGGVFDVFSQQPLTPGMLGRVPGDRMVVMAAALSPTGVFDLIEDLAAVDPFVSESFRQSVAAFNQSAELDLNSDILQQLDEHAVLHGSLNLTNPTAGWVLAVGASSEMALTDPYQRVVELVERTIERDEDFDFTETEVDGNPVYFVNDERGWGGPNVGWSLANGEFLLSLDSSSLRRHIRREPLAADALVNDPWVAAMFKPPHDDASGPVLVSSLDLSAILQVGLAVLTPFAGEVFPPGFSFQDLPDIDVLTRDMKPNVSSVFRTPQGIEYVQRQTWPGGTPVNSAAGLSLATMPGMIQVRRAAARTVSANQIRMLILGLHNYADANGGFPGRYSMDEEESPLLSWRVHILPYLEEQDLYDQFRLDEPWDSEHNLALVEQMPQIFRHPRSDLEPGKTVYMAADGPDSAMPPPGDRTDTTTRPTGVEFSQITDGTSNTAVLLETAPEHGVIWTRPADYRWEDQMRPAEGLNQAWREGVMIGFADGSVRFVTFDQLDQIFEKLVQRSDGEVIRWD